jgi:nucleoside transporter
MGRSGTLRLCLMMFLEYAVRGMWYPFLANYLTAARTDGGLGFSSGQSGWVLGFAGAVGAVAAPAIGGRLADRHLNAERALAGLHCLAGGLLFLNASSRSFGMFLAVMIAFSVAYAPTQSLTTSLAVSHLPDRERQFPRVRLWGTLGWIGTSALFTYVVLRAPDRATNIARIPMAMRAAGAMAVGYAAYALFLLPKTPPAPPSVDAAPSTGLWALFRDRSVLTLALIAIPVAAIHTAYYLNIGPFLSDAVGIPLQWVGPVLAIAQLSEVGCLFALGPVLKRIGYGHVLMLGVAAQAMRFVIFAVDPPPVVVCVALTFHGVAFACFFTTSALYIAKVAPPAIRHSAQTTFGIALFGIGPALAGPYSQLFDRMVVHTATGTVPNFRAIWWAQAGIATACAIAVTVLFRPEPETAVTASAATGGG